ncbi:hypothetical protein, partial [Mesorhizobium sp. M0227]|uniref:hypothetical protein n=1 Tax=unclassified Mesorhizobium TaxID=325217 RepID=UPI0033389241
RRNHRGSRMQELLRKRRLRFRQNMKRSRPAGDTFGFKVDGIYFDVGDSAGWLDRQDGDILLTAFVTAFPDPNNEDGIREERSVVVKRPRP